MDLTDIRQARDRISRYLMATPCRRSPWLDEAVGATVSLKMENLQRTGSFKDRGALNKLLLLSLDDRSRGIVAASAGNHAQALAFHARALGIPATIVMPVVTPMIKVSNTHRYGARVILAGQDYDGAFEEARRLAVEENRVFVHAFDDDAVIAGQGTVALEIIEQLPDIDALVIPVGGGGLIAGAATALKALRPQTRIIGVQTEQIPSMRDALVANHPVEVPHAQTLADGIAVRKVADRTFNVVRRLVDEIVLVGEEEIAAAVLFCLEREKTVAEGAGAAAVAALLENKVFDIAGKTVCVILSGGNIDVTLIGKIIDRALVRDGRMARFRLRISDRPGALAEVANAVAALKANVVEVQHERAFTHTAFNDVEIALTLETRGPDHVTEIRTALEAIAREVVLVQ